MNEKSTFEVFFSDICLDNPSVYSDGVKEITRKLNEKYYETLSDEDHRLIVGSIGRETAVKGTSDVDVLFCLPHSVYERFDKYESNGQSALLQEVRNVLLERYPKTDIKGDGQAVVVSFTDRDYTIDLVPAFETDDGDYEYPDSTDGGRWRTTKPIPEQEQSFKDNALSSGNFKRFCNALRVWKESVGFKFGGLLIDTLVHNYMNDPDIQNATYGYYDALTLIFEKLKEEKADQEYWYALGSNQQVENTGNGAFVRKAKKAYKSLSGAESSLEKEEALISVFGRRFEDCIVDSEVKSRESAWSAEYGSKNSEEFAEQRWPIDIHYRIKIGCYVDQKGFRRKRLLEMLASHLPLRKNKTLTFYIEEDDITNKHKLYWKVRNVGRIAHEKNQVRGQIVLDGGHRQKVERTQFVGPHFVECYAVINGICVARDRIEVPIEDGLDDSTDFLA